jgi:hypothetical protein
MCRRTECADEPNVQTNRISRFSGLTASRDEARAIISPSRASEIIHKYLWLSVAKPRAIFNQTAAHLLPSLLIAATLTHFIIDGSEESQLDATITGY